MSQVGQAHKLLLQHLLWAKGELEKLREMPLENEEGSFIVGLALTHLENALRIGEQIDSGTVYRLPGETA